MDEKNKKIITKVVLSGIVFSYFGTQVIPDGPITGFNILNPPTNYSASKFTFYNPEYEGRSFEPSNLTSSQSITSGDSSSNALRINVFDPATIVG